MNINIICPVNPMGYGVTGYNVLRFAAECGHDITWFPIGGTQMNKFQQDRMEGLLDKIIYRVKQYDPDAPCYRMFHEFDAVMFPAGTGKKMTQVVFELDRINPHDAEMLNSLDAVAVTSEWAKWVLSACEVAVPIHIVPHAVDMGIFGPKAPRTVPINENHPFTFLCVGKWEKRKAQEEVVEAFRQEFKTDEPVKLKLMCDNMFLGPQMAFIKSGHEVPGRIQFIPWAGDQHGVAYEMHQADCGVFASRAEGWNLPLLEMMACNRPVIAPTHTGHTGFLSAETHYNLEYGDLVTAEDGIFFHGEGRWHEIEVEPIRKVMRQAFETGRVGNPAGQVMAESFNWHRTVRAIEEALKA